MREIKARGWDPDTKRWYYGSYVGLERSTPYPMSQTPEADAAKFGAEQVDHYIFFTESMDWGLPTRKLKASVDPKSVGESTGLHDKNGVEIYERDVLEYQPEDYEPEVRSDRYVVEWRGYGFVGVWDRDREVKSRDNDGLNDAHLDIAVVGNVYEHPELITPAT